MAMNINQAAPIIKALERDPQGKRRIRIDLKRQTPEVIASCCHIAHSLDQLGMCLYSQYKKSPNCLLTLKLNGLPATTSYLSGQWFKVAVAEKIKDYQQTNPEVQLVRNLAIRSAAGEQQQLDFIIAFEQRIVVVEVTTGRWQSQLQSLERLHSHFGIPLEQCAVILSERDQQDDQHAGQMHTIDVLAITELEDWLDEQIYASTTTETELPEAVYK
ncbi:hypothetical protein IC617_07605 [Neiella sp. HB171785]|uniref:Uncharacterized protein n=2 Tax=Neiella litorisoli TaxID=2771431 RepID=A0A8J6QQD1_9GAMM|nr:hypothetical protein [Neiella litorisoli]